jgi:hypothetical protein
MREMIKESEPGSALRTELEAVQQCLEKPKHQAVTALLKLLKPALHNETKWFIAKVLESIKDERIIRPMMQALQAPENANRSSYFLWPLIKYDCTKYLWFFVNFITKLEKPDEGMMVAIMVIRAMKGPFDPVVARKCIRALLAEVKTPMTVGWKEQTEALRLEAADHIMAKYFNEMGKQFWKERKGSLPISETAS